MWHCDIKTLNKKFKWISAFAQYTTSYSKKSVAYRHCLNGDFQFRAGTRNPVYTLRLLWMGDFWNPGPGPELKIAVKAMTVCNRLLSRGWRHWANADYSFHFLILYRTDVFSTQMISFFPYRTLLVKPTHTSKGRITIQMRSLRNVRTGMFAL